MPAAIVGVLVSLLPIFQAVAGFSWFIGAILAGLLYRVMTPNDLKAADVSGEAISRPAV